jgi:hypothetical protein
MPDELLKGKYCEKIKWGIKTVLLSAFRENTLNMEKGLKK